MTSWANLIRVGLGRGSSHPGSPVPYPTSSEPYHAIDVSINHLLTLPPTCTPPLSLIHSPSSSLPTRSPPSHILNSYYTSISNYLLGHAPLHNPSHIKPPQTLHLCSCDYSPYHYPPFLCNPCHLYHGHHHKSIHRCYINMLMHPSQ